MLVLVLCKHAAGHAASAQECGDQRRLRGHHGGGGRRPGARVRHRRGLEPVPVEARGRGRQLPHLQERRGRGGRVRGRGHRSLHRGPQRLMQGGG